MNPYVTEFELFHRKRDKVIADFAPSQRMKWGLRLEGSIAAGAAEEMGWTIAPMGVYMRDADNRIGSSFDFQITNQSSVGICEVKNVGADQFNKSWIDHGDGNIEAPPHIELQVQHQLLVSDLEWAAIVALVGGNELHVAIRRRDEQISKKIIAAVAVFWARVEDNKPPSADYSRDADFILQQLSSNVNAGESIVADESMEQLLENYRKASEELDAAEARKNAAKAEFLTKAGTASRVLSRTGTVSCGLSKSTPPKLITPDMVGQPIGGRSGYRMFRYNKKEMQ
jgi:predicted phage-related endonuclease